MKSYRTNDGATFRAGNAREVIRQLRALSHAPGRTVQEFMEGVADRVQSQGSADISTFTPTQFVSGLVQSGLITEVEE